MKRTPSMREQIRTVADRWRGSFHFRIPPIAAKEKQKQLDALDVETATDLDVAKIIGNNSWVSPSECCACKCRKWENIEFETINGKNDVCICLPCLKEAVFVLEHE